jgi:hypothetical protein
MDRLKQIDEDELIRRMRAEFEKTMMEVAQAVNAAPDGHLIDASEERCRDVLGELRRRAYETAVQMRIEATQADVAFSPGEPGAARGGQPDGAELLWPGAAPAAALPPPRRRK